MRESIVISNYLETPDTFYALLINGKWGAGKTFYWKNYISKELVMKTKSVYDPEKEYKPLYISLYGIKTTEEISKRIFYELLPINTTNKWVKFASAFTGKVVSSVSSFFNLGSLEITEQDISNVWNLKNCVIAFDDLERVSTDEDGVGAILGYINYLSEHEGIKVLLLTDEDRLLEKFPSWSKTKEKLVSQEVQFFVDAENAINGLIDSFRSCQQFHQLLIEKQEILLDALSASQTENLRSLRFGLIRLRELWEIINQDKDFERIFGNLFYTVLIIIFEFKKGEVSLNNSRGLVQLSPETIRQEKMRLAINNSQQSGSDSHKKYEVEFSSKYFNRKYNYSISENFYRFIITGIHDITLVKELKNKFLQFDDLEPRVKALDDLRFVRAKALEEADFDAKLKYVLAETEEGNYSLVQYPIIYRLVKQLIDTKIINGEIEVFRKKVGQGVLAAKAKQQEYIYYIEEFLPAEDFPGELSEIRSMVLQINDQYKDKIEKAEILNAFAKFNTEPTLLLDLIFKKESGVVTYSKVFKNVELAELVEVLVNSSNTIICDFNARLKNRLSMTSSWEKEATSLIEFAEMIEKASADNNIHPLKRNYLTYITSNITKMPVPVR